MFEVQRRYDRRFDPQDRSGVLALVGAQWGSEGKGVIAAGLAKHFNAAVRVGGPNAGHSFYHGDDLHKMRGVPCAWVNEAARLFIGAGAVVNPELLVRELDAVNRSITIDPQAMLVNHHHEQQEGSIVKAIGSTGEGVGAARTEKIGRLDARLAGRWDWPDRVKIGPVAWEVAEILANGGAVMLEGTQGSGLSLHHGSYPFVTSSDTNASGIAAEAGIAPSHIKHTHLVARTYPIRVAGNSGPMGGAELSWDYFIERGIVERPEKTTVTQKVRRIAEWDDGVFNRAVVLNNPCGVWLTFGDYLVPELAGFTDPDAVMAAPAIREMVTRISRTWSLPVLGVGMGGDRWKVAQLYPCKHGTEWAW